MASSTQANSKLFARNSKKIEEVKEVIQNKPESDISKVLDYFENDVGKTIDAFVNDGGKEALKKWAEMKQAKKNQNKKNNDANTSVSTDPTNADNETTPKTTSNSRPKSNNKSPKRNTTDESNAKKDNNNNISNNNKRNNNKANLNDLVASIINQYTSATSETDNKPAAIATPAPTPSSTQAEVKPNIVQMQQQPQNQQQLDLLENLNNLVNLSMPLSKALGDLKVKVLSIDQPTRYESSTKTTSPVLSSVTSSPSSMSVVSSMSMSSASTTEKQQPQIRPTLLDLNKNKPTSQAVFAQQRQFNKSYVNPNAKNFLEKSTKDLQRQTVALTKITHQYQEDLTTSQNLLNKTFNDLRKLLNERQNQLQAKLNSLAQTGNAMLVQRQSKAAELKYLADNAVHLNDNELLELKADIKHFISERQLDEEFTRVKCFQDENLDKLCAAINSFGQCAQLNNQYATERPPLNEVLNSASPTPIPSNLQQITSQNKSSNNQQQNNNNNNNNKNGANPNSKPLQPQQTNNSSANNSHVNGASSNKNDLDDEGEFIEVRRPQRNRNKQQQQQQQNQQPQAQQPVVNGQMNGRPLVNGTSSAKPSNGTTFNKKPQRNGDYANFNGNSNKNNRTNGH